MPDDGLGSIDVACRWVGFYRHRSERLGTFPITVKIRQEGNRITGEMYDQITDRSGLLDELIEAHREDISPGKMLQLEAAIRQFGDQAVTVNSHLPDTSDIEGTVAGVLVKFKKTYRGAFEVEWSVGGTGIGSARREGHEVRYSGQLDRERGLIVGEWMIPREGLLGRFLTPEGRGGFELYRKS